MKLSVKRVLSLAGAVMLTVSLALMCSCNDKRPIFPNEPIPLPLEETYTLSYWMNYDNSYTADYVSYGDHPYYKWMEEQTNIHIDFRVPTSPANDISKLLGEWSTLIAAGDMTEMVEHYYFFPQLAEESTTIDSAADEELYYVLNEYIDVQMDNFNKLREEYAVIDKLLITPYNNIMYIPKLTGVEDENKEAPITQGLVIRKDMLDELQEDVPVTIDDWERVLGKMQNALGVANPLMFGTMPLDATLTGDPFLSAYGVSYKFHKNAETGMLDYGCVSEGMRSYLTLLNGWVTQGIMNTTTVLSRDIKLSDNVGAFYATMDEVISLNADAKDLGMTDYELVACPYPVLNEGDTISVYDTYMPIGNKEVNCTYITYACESPALAAKWLDQHFSEDAYMRASYGEKDVDYTENADGTVTFTENVLGNSQGSIFGVYSRCLPSAMFCERDVLVDLVYTEEQLKTIEVWSNVSRERSVIRTTSMNMTIEEEETMADFGNFFFIQFALRDFINGSRSLDEWDSYIEQMNDAGIQEYIQIEQAAWERYLAN